MVTTGAICWSSRSGRPADGRGSRLCRGSALSAALMPRTRSSRALGPDRWGGPQWGMRSRPVATGHRKVYLAHRPRLTARGQTPALGSPSPRTSREAPLPTLPASPSPILLGSPGKPPPAPRVPLHHPLASLDIPENLPGLHTGPSAPHRTLGPTSPLPPLPPPPVPPQRRVARAHGPRSAAREPAS